MRTIEAKNYFRTVGNLLNLYGIDPSVQCLVDPESEDKVIVDMDRINSIIGAHFREHFRDDNRQLSDPATAPAAEYFRIARQEVSDIVRKVKKDKAMGWACIPRAIGLPDDEEFTAAVTDILEDITNSGQFPEQLNCTRLVVLNKAPSQTPQLKQLRPIQIADIVKVYFENLALSELTRLANSDFVTGAEQFGFREKKNTSACILKMLDRWISRHEVAAKKHSNERYFMLFIDWKSAFDRVDHDLLMR
jgi:hypothetical protein